jgi:hypothetical protein
MSMRVLSRASSGIIMLAGLAASSASAQMIQPVNIDPQAGDPVGIAERIAPSRHIIDLGVVEATTKTGQRLAMPARQVWKPICSNRAPMTSADLAQMAASHQASFTDPSKVTVINTNAPAAGLDVVFILSGSVPSGAFGSFATAEAYLEGQFPSDTMTVTIPVSFAALPSGVIGGTGSTQGTLDWPSTRSALVGGMDSSDTIQNFLPSGSTIPVRYTTGTTTNENRAYWNWATWKANGGTVSGDDANMQYSTAFPFDFDPSNGVNSGTISLIDVIVHETGHALGFSSGVDFLFNDIEVNDVFRFRRSDGSSDFNPDTTSEFTTRPRWAVFNSSPSDDVNFDIIGAEYRLSDGNPWQASHFREQTPAIGIMDPAFDFGQTFYPNYFRTSDITVFDAMGYDR